MIVVLFGPPGSGKGTQAAFLRSDLDLVHVSTGDMLRAEATSGSPLGRLIAPVMAAGRLVSDDLIVRVIGERLRRSDAQSGVVLDGFPRTAGQAEALDGMLAERGRRVGLVVVLDVPVAELTERLLGRARDQGRADDTAAVIAERMREYSAKTEPVLVHYRDRGTDIARIDGVGDAGEVRQRVRDVLEAAITGAAAGAASR